MTIIPVDAFQEYLVNSVVKFFKENTTVDFNSGVFNVLYKTWFKNNNKKIRDTLDSFSGILIPEFIAEQKFVNYNNANYVEESLTSTEKTSTLAKTFITFMNLRLLCDNMENLGDVKLRVFIGTMMQILEDQEIPIYDFKNSRATDLKLKWKIQEVEYVNLNEEYKEYQQTVFTISVWCDVFTEETDDRLITNSIVLDPQ